jgi:hypothetical protein
MKMRLMLLALAVGSAAFAQDISVTAPTEAMVGAEITVSFSGPTNPLDFITIVASDAPEGKYDAYQYANSSPAKLTVPALPGEYEIRYLDATSPYPTRWRQALTVADTKTSLEASERVDAGATFEVRWTGPDNKQDFITIVPAGTAEGQYETGYRYTSQGSTLAFQAPDKPGAYELRYLMGIPPYRTLGSRPITVGGTTASITAPAEISAGAEFPVTWEGPDNERDFITIVAADAADKDYAGYVYTKQGSPAQLTAPEDPGPHEVRYLTGQSYAVLARVPIQVLPVSASVTGPEEVEARSVAVVGWEGPDNDLDYVIMVPAGSEPSTSGQYAYTSRGPELRIETPAEPGQYEFRYMTGGKNRMLASQAVTVTPRPVPGKLQVLDGPIQSDQQSGQPSDSAAGGSVVIVLDASGSMLQRIGAERRIDMAKKAVGQLVQKDLPDEVLFSLRVFGHKEKDSCRTDIEIAFAPLNRAQAAATVASIEAMNLAKTPIGATLAAVADDLAKQPGPHVVILLTDGEETCGGDPAAVIQSMVDSGIDVRVNIVGLAIDELMLRETFQQWARIGHGQYLDAKNSEELLSGLTQAIDQSYEVQDASGAVVASGTINGPAIELPEGNYTVHTATRENALNAVVKADETTVLTLTGE